MFLECFSNEDKSNETVSIDIVTWQLNEKIRFDLWDLWKFWITSILGEQDSKRKATKEVKKRQEIRRVML